MEFEITYKNKKGEVNTFIAPTDMLDLADKGLTDIFLPKDYMEFLTQKPLKPSIKTVEAPAVSEVNKLRKDLKAAVKRIEELEKTYPELLER